MAGIVLDTSAIIAYLYDEPGADIAEGAIFGGSQILMPFMALMEVEYKFRRELKSEDDVLEKMAVLLHWPVETRESDPAWGSQAARIKAGGRISLADAWVAALALLNDAELVHDDPEFDSVLGLRALKLPYDRDNAGRGA